MVSDILDRAYLAVTEACPCIQKSVSYQRMNMNFQLPAAVDTKQPVAVAGEGFLRDKFWWRLIGKQP